jgi:sulfite exporter TauE/SafE
MAAFGLGTLPSMLTSSLLASRILGWSKQRWPRLASGALLMACGVWLSLVAVGSWGPAQHHHQHEVALMQSH